MLDEKVIGVALDGTGFGTDGNTWGSEFLICDLADFERITHFEYIRLPGGDSATEEPWRTAVSYLYKVYGIDFLDLKLNVIKKTDPEKIRMIVNMIDKKNKLSSDLRCRKTIRLCSFASRPCSDCNFSGRGSDASGITTVLVATRFMDLTQDRQSVLMKPLEVLSAIYSIALKK